MSKPEKLVDAKLDFGISVKPITTRRGLKIGAGKVWPELNFTLPPMDINPSTWLDIEKLYSEVTRDVCKRTVDLACEGLVIEFELLPPMTMKPEWGGRLCRIITETLDEFHHKEGLKGALRATVIDPRHDAVSAQRRQGRNWDVMLESFLECAGAGADFLAIESIGGKEFHDPALLEADVAGAAFALNVLGARDMDSLWKAIVEIAREYDCLASGDTACGFSNTAMVLADRGMIPRLFASVDRIFSAPRSLAAFKAGAVGPSKDCAYEGPYVKALAGVPIAMEGRTAACAHLSHLGNIAAASCDLWSNESVQDVRLLAARAPVVSLEQLVYDCRLMNTAIAAGPETAKTLQNLHVQSDAGLDPQAFILAPETVVAISDVMAQISDPYAQGVAGAKKAVSLLTEARNAGKVKIPEREEAWLDLLEAQLEELPADGRSLLDSVRAKHSEIPFDPKEYGL